MKSYVNAMKNYAVFSGRTSRSGFWWFTLTLFILFVIGLFIDEGLGLADEEKGVSPIAGAIWLAHALPYFAIQTRRLHDIGKSGWWQLIALIPLAGLVLIVFYATASEAKANEYGPAPSAGTSTDHPVATAIPSSISSSATVEKLEKLASLRASGALDESEFQQMKSELMSQKG